MGKKKFNETMYFNPSLISFKHYHFLICAAPGETEVKKFIKDLKKNNVQLLVRCCGLTYNEDELKPCGIEVEKFKFPEGDLPNDNIVGNFLTVVDKFFDSPDAEKSDQPDRVIGVHCVTGLSRAPLLVAMALAHKGMDIQIAVKVIRKERKAAIDYTQETYIYEQKPQKTKVNKGGCCTIF